MSGMTNFRIFSNIILLAVALILPLLPLDPFMLNAIIFTFLYAHASLAWNIVAGFAGQFSLGHMAFFGIGAYTSSLLFIWYGVTPWIGMLAGAGLAALISFFIGLPSLRLKGHYFVLITIAFGEILRLTFLNWDLVGGSIGIWYPVMPDSLYYFQFHDDRRPYYYIMLGMLLVNLAIAYAIKRSRIGYFLAAIRDDEIAAQTSGLNIAKYKLIAFMISAALTAPVGTFYAQYVLFVYPDDVMSIPLMVYIMLPAIVGGLGTVSGPLIGALILVPTAEYVRAYMGGVAGMQLIMYGVILVLVVLIMPRGLVGSLRRTKLGMSIGKYISLV